MTDCKDQKSAEKYLRDRSYKEVQATNDNRLGFNAHSGDGSWEEGVAAENEWFRQEQGKCCLGIARTNHDHRYCGVCGTGINGTSSWTKGQSSDLNALEEMLELQEDC